MLWVVLPYKTVKQKISSVITNIVLNNIFRRSMIKGKIVAVLLD